MPIGLSGHRSCRQSHSATAGQLEAGTHAFGFEARRTMDNLFDFGLVDAVFTTTASTKG